MTPDQAIPATGGPRGLRWIGHMLSGIGGHVDLTRVTWLAMCVTYIALCWSERARFTPIEFASGALLILTGGAGAVGGKEIAMAIARGKAATTPAAGEAP